MKVKNDERGRRALKLLIIVIVIATIGAGAWYVGKYSDTAKTVSPTASQATDNETAGWQEYNDDFVSFKYPAGWRPERDDNINLPGTKELKLSGPSDNAVAASSEASQGQKAIVLLSIFEEVSPGCNCKVYDVLPLSNKQTPKASLAITSDINFGGNPSGPPMSLVMTDDTAVTAGAVKLKDGITVGSYNVGVLAVVKVDEVVGYPIEDLTTFKKSQSFQDLIKILNTLSVK